MVACEGVVMKRYFMIALLSSATAEFVRSEAKSELLKLEL